MYKNIIIIILLIFLIFFQMSFVTAFAAPFSNLNLILSICVFTVLIYDFSTAAKLGLLLSLIMEIYSSMVFGVILVSLFITIIALYLLFINLFTNKSLYSLITLSALGTIVYGLLITLFNNLFYYLGVSNFKFILNYNFLLNYFFEILLNIVVLIMFFYLYNFLTKELKAYFIVPKKQ